MGADLFQLAQAMRHRFSSLPDGPFQCFHILRRIAYQHLTAADEFKTSSSASLSHELIAPSAQSLAFQRNLCLKANPPWITPEFRPLVS